MKANKITEHVYADTSGEGRGNIGAIELPNYTVVIDSTMFPQTASAFRTSLESQIRSPIRKLVLTHGHSDHVFGNQIFRDCDIISSNTLKERMEKQAQTEWTKEKLIEYEKSLPDLAGKLREVEITTPTTTFEETLTLRDEDSSVTVTHSGGHSKDSSYLYFPTEKTLVSGDLIFAKSFPYGADDTCNPEKWIETLKHFREMPVKHIIPGHGPICDLEEVEIYLKFFQETATVLKELVQKRLNEKEIAEHKGFPDFYPPRRPETRTASFLNWYNFYKQQNRT